MNNFFSQKRNKIIIGIVLLITTVTIITAVLLTLPKKGKSNETSARSTSARSTSARSTPARSTCGNNERFMHGSCLDDDHSRSDLDSEETTKTRYSNFINIEQGKCAYDYNANVENAYRKVTQCPLNYPSCQGYEEGTSWGTCRAN